MGRRAAIVAVTVTAAVGGVVLTTTPGGGGSSGLTTANIWVDETATTGCTDNASLVAYSASTDCTWDQAHDTCEAGDIVGIKGGPYGDVTLTDVQGRSGMCEFEVADGEAVTMDEFENGTCCGLGSDNGGDWMTISAGTGSIQAKSLRSDQNNQMVFDGWLVDAEFTDPDNGAYSQIVHFENATNTVFRDGEIRNACSETNQGGMVVLTGSSGGPTTLQDSVIHDAHMCDPTGDPHTECVWASAANTVTLRGNIFHHCGVMSVFVTGHDGDNFISSWTVENNVIGRPCSNNESPHVCTTPGGNAFHFRNGGGGSGDPAPIPSGWLIRNNTFRGNMTGNTYATPPVANVVTNNAFLNGAECSLPNTTYSYNAHVSGSCGGTGTITNASLLSNSFTDPDDYDVTGGDWSLLTGSPLKNAGNPSSYASTDRAGNTRYDGSAPDIGAYEFQE